MKKLLLIGCLMISSLFGGIASSEGFVDVTSKQDRFKQEQKMGTNGFIDTLKLIINFKEVEPMLSDNTLKSKMEFANGLTNGFQKKMMDNCKDKRVYDQKNKINMKILIVDENNKIYNGFLINKESCELWNEIYN